MLVLLRGLHAYLAIHILPAALDELLRVDLSGNCTIPRNPVMNSLRLEQRATQDLDILSADERERFYTAFSVSKKAAADYDLSHPAPKLSPQGITEHSDTSAL